MKEGNNKNHTRAELVMFFDISLVSFTALIKLFDCVLIAWKIEKNIFRLVQEMEVQVCSSRKSQ